MRHTRQDWGFATALQWGRCASILRMLLIRRAIEDSEGVRRNCCNAGLARRFQPARLRHSG